MSKQQGKSNVADDAARARKLLDKHAPVKVSGLNKGNYTLQQGVNQNLGEHAVIVIISDQTVHQYTISRPIGVTDGDEKLDWALNSTEYIPSMMARKVDPALGALNQNRAQLRTQLAVDAGLLKTKGIGGKHVHFYPNRDDVSRNDLLNEARERLKADQRALREKLDATTDRAEQVAYRNQLAQLTDPTEYLDEVTAASEEKLREFWQSEEVQEVIEIECPQLYRTLTGPYADQKQVIIAGAKGKSLDAVVNAVSAKIAKIAIAPPVAETPTGGTQTPKSGNQTPESGPVSTPSTRVSTAFSEEAKKTLRSKAMAFGQKLINFRPNGQVVQQQQNAAADQPQEVVKVNTPTPPPVSPPRPPAAGGSSDVKKE